MEYLVLYIAALVLAHAAFGSIRMSVKVYKNGAVETINEILNKTLKVKYDLAGYVGLNKSQSIITFVYTAAVILRVSAIFIVLKYIIQTTT